MAKDKQPSEADVADGVVAAANVQDELARLLKVPHDDVVIRSIKGPDGIDPLLGLVRMGRLYTIDFATAARYCEGPNPRFEPVLTVDRERIEAASKQAAAVAAERERMQKELDALGAK